MSGHDTVSRPSYPKPKLVGLIKGPSFLEHELVGHDGNIIPVIDDDSGNSYIIHNNSKVEVAEAINKGIINDFNDIHRKLSQSGYDLFAKNAKIAGQEINIPVGVDTSEIALRKDLKHNFIGANIIGRVPKGSTIGEGSTIESGAILENCIIERDCIAGDDVTIVNSRIGACFEGGFQLKIDNCLVDSCMAAASIEQLSNSTLNYGLTVESIETFGDNNILLPGYHVGQIEAMGTNNVIVGERRLPKPETGGEGNLCVNATIAPIPMNSTADDIYQMRDKLKADKSIKQVWDKFSQAHETADLLADDVKPGF